MPRALARQAGGDGGVSQGTGRVAADRQQQIEIEATVLRTLSDELAILPINYRIEAITVSKGLTGVPPRGSTPSATNTWNVETWERKS